ncbi:MAG: Lhr family helicase, partial [Acidimicrobiales bacterium]
AGEGAALAAASRAAVEAGTVLAGVLLERHGVLTRDAVRSEAVPGGFASIYQVLKAMEESGRARRGYFIAGLGGAQFAVPGAVDRLRSVRVPAVGAGVAGGAGFAPRPDRPEVTVLAATDPASVWGSVLPWPVKGPARVAGAHVVSVDGLPSAYLERGGRGLLALRPLDGTWEEHVVGALEHLVDSGRWSRLTLQRFPEALGGHLRRAGFVPTPRGLVRYR